MAVLSAQDVERFTPDRYLVDGEVPPGVPVYLIAPMTWRERARFRAQTASEGVRFPQDAEIAKTLRSVIKELAPSNQDELLAVVQAFEDVLAGPVLEPLQDGASEAEAVDHAGEERRRADVVTAYETLVDRLRQHPDVGALLSLRTLFFEVVPPLAAAFCLRGWENVELKFERVGGIVPDRVLDRLQGDDLLAIGNKALALQTITAAQRGN